MPELTDNDKMPFGKYKGKSLIEVPASYLIYCYENYNLREALKNYIKNNMDVLKQQAKDEVS
jgi:hypothetical protein